MVDWVGQLRDVLAGGQACVLVTVIAARGSTPRECGAKMIVTGTGAIGSIGGGNLEYESMHAARALLGEASQPDSSNVLAPRIAEFALGARLGQCCGGHARVLFEPLTRAEPWVAACAEGSSGVARGVLVTVVDDDSTGDLSMAGAKLFVTARSVHGEVGRKPLHRQVVESARALLHEAGRPGVAALRLESPGRSPSATILYELLCDSRPRLWLFGAGHVGRALVAVLGESPCRIVWVDGRAEQFPRDIPGNVEVRISALPVHCVDEASASDSFLVMTHSHALDLQLVERVLEGGRFRFLGLIGSTTKRRRFEKQLRRRGIAECRLSRLVCPIGIAGITAKHPRSIAVAIAAQLLRTWESTQAPEADTDPVPAQPEALSRRHGVEKR